MADVPFLNGLRAFEAAARTGSFVGAAKLLNVTPAAISRMVKLLEARLGVSLFERSANRLLLTEAGRTYQAGLAQIFEQLSRLTTLIQTLGGSRILTVGVGPTFAIRWLIPRLAEFNKRAPDIEVRITTGGAAVPFADDWTCGIKLGNGHWPGLLAEPLLSADLMPVCAPALAQRLKSPNALSDASLLRVAHASKDWPQWLKKAGVLNVTAKGPIFEYYGHALQAAADGVGVAMGIRPYIDDDIAAGRLVAPFSLSVPKSERWYLVFKDVRRGEPAFEAFHGWIKDCIDSRAANGTASAD
jgi:LysR family glycine cleavage system transcriptional activator